VLSLARRQIFCNELEFNVVAGEVRQPLGILRAKSVIIGWLVKPTFVVCH
jgi:hypothetical protein